MALMIIPFQTAPHAWFTLIIIVVCVILDIVSFSVRWTSWSSDATPWAIHIANIGWYQLNSECTFKFAGQTVTYYDDEPCRYWNAIRAMIMLGFLTTVTCGIVLFLSLFLPKYLQRFKKGFESPTAPRPRTNIVISVYPAPPPPSPQGAGLLVVIMLVSWVFNIIGLSVFVGYSMKGVENIGWTSKRLVGFPKQSFPWEPGFILLIVVIILQMLIILTLFPTMDAILQFRLPLQDQLEPMLQFQSQSYAQQGTYQPPQPQPYGVLPPGYTAAAPAAHQAYPPYPYPPHPAQAPAAAPSSGWPYPPHPQAGPAAGSPLAGWPYPPHPHPAQTAPGAWAPHAAWRYPPPHGWPFPPPPNMTTPPPAGGWPYPPYPYPHPYPYPTPATTTSPTPNPVAPSEPEPSAPAPAPAPAPVPDEDPCVDVSPSVH